jgi:hypothetical protein
MTASILSGWLARACSEGPESALGVDRRSRSIAAIEVATQRCGAAFALLPFVHRAAFLSANAGLWDLPAVCCKLTQDRFMRRV